MIISHKHKYIFVKTSKVAGTSTEIFFQKISFSGKETHTTPEIINEDGIIGFRGTRKNIREQNVTWYNHMSLPKIKKTLNHDKLFNEYFKFSITRNPWDRVVSAYHHFSSQSSFNEYIANGKMVGPIAPDFGNCIDDVFFIRFENLQEGIEYVCKKLGLDYDMRNLGSYKNQHRASSRHKHYTEYYDDVTREIVAKKYARDIKHFGYEFGE
jgi:hypothetical protein